MTFANFANTLRASDEIVTVFPLRAMLPAAAVRAVVAWVTKAEVEMIVLALCVAEECKKLPRKGGQRCLGLSLPSEFAICL